MSLRVNSSKSLSAFPQSVHEISLSWQYALLLPFCVLDISSPESSMGTPCERNKVVRKLRFCLFRHSFTMGSSLGPSSPQFHERLSFIPSWLFSPFAPLCLSLYDTKSLRVNPSCTVIKLMLATGLRKLSRYKSELPVKRVANSGNALSAPRQKSRMQSRYFPFHSAHPGGNFPTW